MKLVVIGATGYIGSALTAYAKEKGIQVIGTSSNGGMNKLPFQLSMPDKFDYGIINPGDAVLFAAAVSNPDACATDPERVRAINVTGSARAIERFISQGAHVVFFSSDTVYGETEQTVDENAYCNPIGAYAMMKRDIEQYFYEHALFKSLRLSYVFSKGDKFTSYLQLCNQNGNNAEVYHPLFRAIVHLQDVLEGIYILTQHWTKFPHPVINIGGPRLVSRVELTKLIKQYAYPHLKYTSVDPGESFFENRPKLIHMSSPIFSDLLGRPARTIGEAVIAELNT